MQIFYSELSLWKPLYKRVLPPLETRSMTAFWHVCTSFLLLCLTHWLLYLLRLALNVTPSLPTSPADSLSFRQAAPHSARLVSIIQDFLKLCNIGFKVKETPPRNQRFRSSHKGWTFCAFSLLFTPSAIRHAVSDGSFFAGSASVPNPPPRR